MNLFSKIFCSLGLLFGIVGGGFFFYDNHLRKICTEPVLATVVQNVPRKDGSRGTILTVAPVFEFERGGQKFCIESATSSYPPKYEIGEQVRLLLNPDEPETFRADGENVLRIIAAIFGGFFVLFFGAGIFIHFHSIGKN